MVMTARAQKSPVAAVCNLIIQTRKVNYRATTTHAITFGRIWKYILIHIITHSVMFVLGVNNRRVFSVDKTSMDTRTANVLTAVFFYRFPIIGMPITYASNLLFLY